MNAISHQGGMIQGEGQCENPIVFQKIGKIGKSFFQKKERVSASTRRRMKIESTINDCDKYKNKLDEKNEEEKKNTYLAKLKMKQHQKVLSYYLGIPKEKKEKKDIVEKLKIKLLMEYNDIITRMHTNNKEIISMTNQFKKMKNKINNLLVEDDVKNKYENDKKEEMNRRKDIMSNKGGISIDKLCKLLPEEIINSIYEFLPYDTRIEYLEDVYKPYPKFNRQDIRIKKYFMEIILKSLKNFKTIPKKQRHQYSNMIYLSKNNYVNQLIKNIITNLKKTYPIDAYKLIKNLCILFKNNNKYNLNYLVYIQKTREIILENKKETKDIN